MDAEGPVGASSWLMKPRQQEIHRRLGLLGPGPASAYIDACRILASEPPFEFATHLVAHCLREIEGSLLSFLCPPETEVAGHSKRIGVILGSLGLAPDDPAAQRWLALASEGLHRWAHRRGLAEPRPMDQQFVQLWHETEDILDAVTERMERRYLTYRDRLDDLAAKDAPTGHDMRFLREGVPNNPLALGRFFERVTSPNWLGPLRKHGYFRYPPAPRHDPETGHVILPPWPQGWYLAHVATADENAAAEVAAIIAELPETENRRVDAYEVEAALGMPPAAAASVVPVICKRIAARPPLLPDDVGKLAVRLVAAHQIGEALALAEHLLALQRWVPSETEEATLFPERPRPLPRIERWQYEHVLRALVPQLVDHASARALELFCDLLQAAVEMSRRATDPPPPHDDSYSWRPAIEDHAQNMDLDVTGDLTSAVRDATEQLAEQEPGRVPLLVAALEQRPWRVFHRVALHLLRRHAEGSMDLVAARLTDRALFDDPDCRYEYVHLLGECFSTLSADQQSAILAWIDAGPDLEAERQFHREVTGEEPTDDDIAQAARAWRRDRLAPIARHLTGGRREAYEQWVAEVGEPEHPDFVAYHETFMGSVSPEWADQLPGMPTEEIIGRLKSFTPIQGFRAPTPRGLGDALTGCVAARPAEFARSATSFCEVEATYVRAVVDGLKQAVANRDPFPWEPVLELCAWAVAQQDAVEQDQLAKAWDRDPTWRWTRSAIAHGGPLRASRADVERDRALDA